MNEENKRLKISVLVVACTVILAVLIGVYGWMQGIIFGWGLGIGIYIMMLISTNLKDSTTQLVACFIVGVVLTASVYSYMPTTPPEFNVWMYLLFAFLIGAFIGSVLVPLMDLKVKMPN